MVPGRLRQQCTFLRTLDALKHVKRRTLTSSRDDDIRAENPAEHSWHLAVMAHVLREYAPANINIDRVTQICLMHDVVEIDADDTFLYDDAANANKRAREEAAAERIFGLLPPDQAAWARALWEEYETGATREAKFVLALDRTQPILQHVQTAGRAWRTHGITRQRVEQKCRPPIETGSAALWQYVGAVLDDCVQLGYVRDEQGTERYKARPLFLPVESGSLDEAILFSIPLQQRYPFRIFIETGEAEDVFKHFLDHDAAARALVERIITSQANTLRAALNRADIDTRSSP